MGGGAYPHTQYKITRKKKLRRFARAWNGMEGTVTTRSASLSLLSVHACAAIGVAFFSFSSELPFFHGAHGGLSQRFVRRRASSANHLGTGRSWPASRVWWRARWLDPCDAAVISYRETVTLKGKESSSPICMCILNIAMWVGGVKASLSSAMIV